MNSKPLRYEYVDVMKGIAIFLVVVGHVLAGFKSESMNSWDNMVLWKFVYSFHMPLFMFISGFVCFNPLKKYSIKNILKRIISYMIPFFTMGFLIGVLRDKYNYSQLWYFRTLTIFVLVLWTGMISYDFFIKNSRQIIRTICVSLWFLFVIYLFKYISNNNMFVGVYVIGIDSITHLFLFLFFLLGWICREHVHFVDIYLHNDVVLIVSIILLLVVYIFNIQFSNILIPIITILFILNLSTLKSLLDSFYFSKIGGLTKDIYIIHFFLLLKLPMVGDFLMEHTSHGMMYQIMLQIVLSVPFAVLIIWISQKISSVVKDSPLLSLFVLGDLKFFSQYKRK